MALKDILAPEARRNVAPGMHPNRVVLAYVAALAVALTMTLALASVAAVLRAGGVLLGRSLGTVDGWLIAAVIISLGIMPWPVLVALGRALFVPGRLDEFRVVTRPVGTAAVALVAFNEEHAIEDAVRGFAAAPGVGVVIVADNGSTDQTPAIAAAAGARVVQEERRGYGHACIRALKGGLGSGQPIVILCEADQTFRADDIEKLAAYLKHADLVIGSRTHGALLSGDSQLDSFFALGNVFIAKLLQFRYWDWKIGGRLRLTDVGCTYRAIRADALARILPALEVGGNHFGPHMVMVALEHGLRLVEVPVTFWKRVGVSKGGSASWGSGFRLGLAMIWHILTYRVRRVPMHEAPPKAESEPAAVSIPVRSPGMRVLYMATRDGYHPDAAGGDIQSWEYARYLASAGHHVTYVAASSPGAASEETLDGIRVVRLRGVLSLWLRTFLYYMRSCRDRYDVVVTEGFGGSRIPRLAPLYVKEPIITEWRQIYARIFPHQYRRILAAPLNALESFTAWVHRHTVVLAFTSEWQEAFRTLGFKRENIFRVPVSIRDEWLSMDGHRLVAEPRIIWIGKFHRYKCPHHLILAMKQVMAEIPDARLILAGRRSDAKYENELMSLARDLGVEGHVEFRFNIPEDEKWSLLRRSRVLILPSSVEGFGIVVLEANASGLPVIASSGVPESAVCHGLNGLRYPFGDIRALAQCVVSLLKDEDLHASLSENGRLFAQQFGWKAVGEQFEAVVRHALQRRAGHRVGLS